VHRKHEDQFLRVLVGQESNQFQARFSPQADIDNDDGWPKPLDGGDRVLRLVRRPANLQVGLLVDEARKPVAHQRMVIDQEDRFCFVLRFHAQVLIDVLPFSGRFAPPE
jgi:hypothetical protein